MAELLASATWNHPNAMTEWKRCHGQAVAVAAYHTRREIKDGFRKSGEGEREHEGFHDDVNDAFKKFSDKRLDSENHTHTHTKKCHSG